MFLYVCYYYHKAYEDYPELIKHLCFKLIETTMLGHFGSQEVEQVFSTMRDLDPSGLATPKPDVIPSIMATPSLLDNTRMDPARYIQLK